MDLAKVVIATFCKRIPGAVWKPVEVCCGETMHGRSILQTALLGSFSVKRNKEMGRCDLKVNSLFSLY